MTKVASFIIVVAVLLCLCPRNAAACTCREPNPGEQLATSALVFEGRVISVTENPEAGSLGSHVARTENEFRVIRAWKGTEAGARVMVTTPIPGSMCFETLPRGRSNAPGLPPKQRTGNLPNKPLPPREPNPNEFPHRKNF